MAIIFTCDRCRGSAHPGPDISGGPALPTGWRTAQIGNKELDLCQRCHAAVERFATEAPPQARPDEEPF